MFAACTAPLGAPGREFRSTCAQAAATLQSTAATAPPLSAAFVAGTGAAVKQLATRIGAGRHALATARTPKAQAAAHARLAKAYGSASTAIAAAAAHTGADAAAAPLVRAFRALQTDHRTLATAARDRTPKRYARAAARTRADEQSAGAAIAALRRHI